MQCEIMAGTFLLISPTEVRVINSVLWPLAFIILASVSLSNLLACSSEIPEESSSFKISGLSR